MTLDELAGLLAASRFLPTRDAAAREALRILPELADGMPPVLCDARGAHVWSGCGEVVRAASTLLPAQLLAAARGESGEDVSNDPLVVALERLVVEGARHGPGAAVVPLLEAVRVAQGLFAADPAFAGLRADPAGLRRVAAAVQVRLAMACARAERSGRVPALAWALSRDRLLPIYPRGTLDRDPAWSEVAAVLDVPFPPDTYETTERAVRLAVRGIAERRAAGKSTADDASVLLRFLPATRLDPGAEPAAAALLADPDAIAALLPALGRFVELKPLVAAGVDKARAERLLTPAGGLAAASVLGELLDALRSWDVLSQLAEAVGPAPLRTLGVPRTTPTKAMVVAVGAGRLRADGAQREAAWDDLAQRVEQGVVVPGTGLVVFPDAVDALRFAIAVRGRLPAVSVGMAWGGVFGGTDGRTARVHGPAVDAALRWVAGAAANRADGVEGGLRSVGGWLAGTGIGLDVAASEAIQESRVRRGLATLADGAPGGDPRVPRSVDLHRAVELDGGVLALVRVPGVTGGFEALYMPLPAWLSLLERDAERSAPSTASVVKAVAEAIAVPEPAVAEPEAEDGGGWEMAEQEELPETAPVTLDLGEHTGEAWAASATEPTFELDPEAPPPGAASEDVEVFTGFYLPGTEAAAAPPPAPAPAAAPSPSFDLSVEDDEEESTAEWAHVQAAPPRTAARERSFAPPVMTEDLFAADPPPPLPPRPAAGPARPAADARASADPFADPDGDPFGGVDPFAGVGVPAAVDPFAASTGPSRAAHEPDDPFAGFSATPGGDPFEGFATPAPAAPAGAAPAGGRAGGALDFDFLLKGYACYFERREAVFGRPYGTRMVDRHAYPWSGDPDAAYVAFLRDKIREGFVPRAELVGDLPRGVTLMPLDTASLQRAWKDLA